MSLVPSAPHSPVRTGGAVPAAGPAVLPSTAEQVSDLTVDAGQRRGPWLMAIVVVMTTGLLLLFAPGEVGAHPAFLPAFLAIVLASDLLTGVLLIEQYRAGGSPRLFVLSWAYVWSAATIVPHAMVFTGLFTAQGLLGAVPSSAPWLWVSWHVGFPVFIGLALMPWPRSWVDVLGRASGRGRRILLSVVLILTGSWGFAALVTAGADLMPVIITDGDYTALTERFGPWIGVVVVAAAGAGLLGLVRRRRPGLELWAFVALVAGVGDMAVTLLARDRFTVGWYGARGLALTASVAVLFAMLHEITALHRRVLRAADLLEQQNDELSQTQALRDHLVAVVSHDLRTPVAGLTGYLELLGDGGLTVQQSHRMLENSQRLTRHLTLLIEDLLAVATAQRGVLDVRPERIDVRRALEEAAGGFPESDVRLDCSPGLEAWVDPLRLQQVLANLVGNAVKYGADPVLVRAGPGGGPLGARGVRLEVRDSGDGVPADFVERLFDPYARAEGLTAQGSGLGLSVVRDLVAAHGGEVSYDAAGNTFVVTLPAADAGVGAAG